MTTVKDITLTIDPELEELLPHHTAEEEQALKEAVDKDGHFTDDLLYWRHNGKLILIDGHRRYRLWKTLPDNTPIAPPHVKEVHLPDRDAVVEWMIRRQLGRRNLDPDSASELRGRLYNQKAKSAKNQANESLRHSAENPGGRPASPEREAARAVAQEAGVSERTVRRDGEYATALDAIGSVNSKAKHDIESKVLKVSRKDVIAIAKSGDIPAALKNLRNGKKWNDGAPRKPKVHRADADMPPRQLDEDGNEVPSNLIGVFEARATFRLISRKLRDLSGELSELKTQTAGRYLEKAPQLAEELADYVDAAMPAKVVNRGWVPKGGVDA